MLIKLGVNSFYFFNRFRYHENRQQYLRPPVPPPQNRLNEFPLGPKFSRMEKEMMIDIFHSDKKLFRDWSHGRFLERLKKDEIKG
jgi:hypothetical protein